MFSERAREYVGMKIDHHHNTLFKASSTAPDLNPTNLDLMIPSLSITNMVGIDTDSCPK